MSFTVYSAAAPQSGEEQPLSSTAKLVSPWATLDISAAFPGGEIPYSAKALIILGADLPIGCGVLGRLRVRKFGESTSFEEASGATGVTSIVNRDGDEYQSGGFSATVVIPVDTDGKFEYQLQNDSDAPRTIIRILEVMTSEEIPDSVPATEKGVANGVASLDGSALTVENPANATVTPAAGKIPLADGSGKLDSWVTPSALPAFEIIGALNVEASHTGDTAETTLKTITIPGGKMGPNGFVRIFSSWRCIGAAGNKHWRVYFGGLEIEKQTGVTGSGKMSDFTPKFVWNTGVTNVQGSTIKWGTYHGRAGEGPIVGAIDTTADVDVTFTVQNTNAADTSYLRFALVEAFYQG